MSNEVATTNKNQLPVIGFGSQGLVPTDFSGAWRCAQLVAASGLAPSGFNGKPEAILVAAAMGAEIGLTFMQSIQSIAVINGRPSVWGDALLALCEATGELVEFSETYEGSGEDAAVVCRATRLRKGNIKRTAEERFSVEDAKKAELWNKKGPWQAYPKRMMKMRARSFVLRDLFADILRGVRATEEAMDSKDDFIIETVKPATFDLTPAPVQPTPEMTTPEMTTTPDAEIVDNETGEVTPAAPPEEERPLVDSYESSAAKEEKKPDAANSATEKPSRVKCPNPGGRKPGMMMALAACREVCPQYPGCTALKGVE